MDHTGTQWHFREGDRVISAGEKTLGKVVAVAPDPAHLTHLVVRGGFLSHHEYWIPVSTIALQDGRHISIDATKADVERQGWQQKPVFHQRAQARSAMKPSRDPVCGMPVEPSGTPAQSRYRGTVYSFCSRECKQAFDAHPERYVSITHTSASPVNDQQAHPR